MILLTGGSACGKSSYAEGLCMAFPGPRYYLAAMRPAGEGGMEKIARHRAMRAGKGFETIERYTGYDHLKLPRRGTALLECICNLTANEMFDERGNITDPVRPVLDGVEAAIRDWFNGRLLGRDILRAQLGHLIFGCDGVVNYKIKAPAADLTVEPDQLPRLGELNVEGLT